MKIIIIIQPISFELTAELSTSLEQQLSKDFDALVRILPPIKDTLLPLDSFDKNRRQWKSNNILQWILDRKKTDRSMKILAICDFDAYSNGLNFVFGQATFDGRASAIYLARLRQEFYGLKKNNSLFYQRVVKEAVHELGHAFGLNHCNKSACIMHFSNSLRDTDIKENKFCDNCRTRLTC
jgi:archaemetzincin